MATSTTVVAPMVAVTAVVATAEEASVAEVTVRPLRRCATKHCPY
jgi:hypothetical protein